MKALLLLWHVFAIETCLAQTVVYTTGSNGETSAYLIVGNGTTSISSSSSSLSPTSTTSQNVTSTPPKTTSIMLPTVPYTGQALLTGDCSIAMYTTLRYLDGHFLEVPLIGCSDDRPECCPSLPISPSGPASTAQGLSGSTTSTGSLTPTGVISLLNQAPLTVCPKDMTDLDPVCCPSGFTKWGTAILGNTPCASPLSTSYPVPSSALNSLASAVGASTTVLAGAAEATQSVTVIVNVVFALGLLCADDDEEGEDHKGLSTGAKAGIGVGVGIGVLLATGLGILLFTRHRRRKLAKTSGTGTNTTAGSAAAATATAEAVGTSHRAEKESTGFTSQTIEYYPDKSKQQHQHPNSGVWGPASGSGMSDTGFTQAGYGQGFVDGVRAALSPPPPMPPGHPQSPPPPFYGAHVSPQAGLGVYDRNSERDLVVEAPTGTERYSHGQRLVGQDEAAELSGSNTEGSIGYWNGGDGRNARSSAS